MKLISVLNYVSKGKILSKIVNPKIKVESPEKLKKAELFKRINKENKSLFGSVIKSPSKKKSKFIDVKIKTEDSTENEKSSEFYWLIEHSNSRVKPVVPNEIENNGKHFSINSYIDDINDKQIEIKTSENLKNNSLIPFSSKGIKQIFKFPLIKNGINNVIEYNEEYTDELPSVGKILSLTLSENTRKILMEWKLSKIKELGIDGYNLLKQEHFRKGKELHQAIETYFKTEMEPKPDSEVFRTWKSIYPIIDDLKPKPELIETFVKHPLLKYKGVVDCVSQIGSNLNVIEWKKSDKPKINIYNTYDAPVQLAAYLGALNYDPKFKYSLKTGYVVVAYTNGKPGNLFQINEIDMQKYWELWLKRLQEYWIRTRDGTLPEPI